jgi:hypothetical protein
MPISISIIGSRAVARPERWLRLWLITLTLTPALAAEAPKPAPPEVSLELLEFLGGIDTVPPNTASAPVAESRPAGDPHPASPPTATGVKP